MKNLILFVFLLVGFVSFGQSYTPYFVSDSIIKRQDLIYEKGDSMIVLVNNSVTPPTVYVLENMTTPNYISPTLVTGWTTTILQKQHKTIYYFTTYPHNEIVNDNNGYSYMRIH